MHCPPHRPSPLSKSLPITRRQVLLERELAKLSAELDKDLRAIETGQPSPKVPASQSPPGGRQEPGAAAAGPGWEAQADERRRLQPHSRPWETSSLFALSFLKCRAFTVPSDP